MNQKTLRQLVTGLALCGVALAVVFGIYRYQYPHGTRPCRLPCTMMALRSYSRDNQGWFPDGGRIGVDALSKLYPEYANAKLLGGISGSESQAQKSLASKGSLDERASSWIYWPGFHEDDDPQIAIIWEKEEGLEPVMHFWRTRIGA